MNTTRWIALAVAITLTVGISGVVFSQDTVPLETLPFSAARQAGSTLYVSGQIGVRPDGTPVEGSVAAETRQAMHNIQQALKEHGYDFGDIVKVTVFLSDMKHYETMNAAYRQFFPDGNFPARECVGGLQIAYGLNLEISCIAYKQGPHLMPLASREPRPHAINRGSSS